MNNLLKQHSKRRSGDKRDGFTVIEMVVVIAVIVLLSAIVAPLAISVIKDARIAKTQGDVSSIAKAIQRYRIDTGAYPFKNSSSSPLTPDFATLSTANGTNPTVNASVTTWTTPVDAYDGTACGTSGNPGTDIGADKLRLNEHLLTNGPGWPEDQKPKKKQWKGREKRKYPTESVATHCGHRLGEDPIPPEPRHSATGSGLVHQWS